ncbi:Tubulin-specific chaperone C [Pleurostoma richardsiae]|uniref:Tubulin-specific chaperone C n=1 Tax=Pleurostoma richardsiae TaxID=41990 RepID=A0AA38RU85_9PEZI|nr:Tubulin-specific chaperone C [Pleurostoma richardsiae]
MADSLFMVGPMAYNSAFPGLHTNMDQKELFYRHFQAAVTSIQEQISQLSSIAVAGGERQDAIENILAGISRLSNEVSDASDYVPAYDQRLYSEAVKALREQLDEETAKLAPKKSRFQFKPRVENPSSSEPRKDDPRLMLSRPDQGASSTGSQDEADSLGALPSFKNYNEEMARPTAKGIRKPSFSNAKNIAITGHTGLHIILPSTASHATSSGSLTDLKGCVVDMSVPTARGAPFAGLAVKNIDKSLIIAGHVDGPAHITGVRDSVVVVAARQVRIHECKNVDIYLYCTSHPIIEDCSGMRFAPLPACYAAAGIEPDKNQWDQVDDFKWLKAEHSPHWQVLPKEERIPEDVWKHSVPGGPGLGVEDVLKVVGISAK